MQPFPIAPRFASVTYVGSLKLAGPSTGVVPFETPRSTLHQFKVTGEDLVTFQPFATRQGVVQLRETVIPTQYGGDIRPGMNTVVEGLLFPSPDTSGNSGIEVPDSTMFVSPQDIERVEMLLNKADKPPSSKVDGSPDPLLGGANPNHKPLFHVDFPSLELLNLDEVKSTLRRGLAMNLFKQVLSTTTNPESLVGTLTTLLKNTGNR